MADLQSREDLTQIGTTSTSYINASTLIWTPPSTADYLVLVMLEVKHSSATNWASVRVIVNSDTANPIAQIEFEPHNAADYFPVQCAAIVNFASGGSRRIDVQIAVVSAGTTTYRNVRILAWAVPFAFTSKSLAIVTNATTNYVDALTPLSIGAGNAGDYLLFWSGGFSSSATGYRSQIRCGVDLDAPQQVTVGQADIKQEAANNFMPAGGFRIVTLDAAAHTASLQQKRSGGSGSVSARQTYLHLIRIDTASDFAPFVPATDPRYGEVENTVDVTGGTTLPAPTGGTVSITYTPNPTTYLLLATAHISYSSTSSAAQYDVLLDGADEIAGPGQFSPGATNMVIAFFSFRFKTLTASAKTDALRFAPGVTTLHLTRSLIRQLALEVGLGSSGLESIGVTEMVDAFVQSILDAETLTLADMLEVSFLLDEGLSLTDLLETLLTLTSEEPAVLAEAVLALIIPRQPSKAFYGPVQLVEIFFRSGVRRYSHRDIYVTHSTPGWVDTLFKGIQIGTADFPNAFADPFYGFQNLESADFTFGNLTGEFTFTRGEECRGVLLRSWAWDPVNVELALRFVGTVTHRALGMQATFAATMQSLPLFQRQIPDHVIATTEFPRAGDVGEPIPIVIGSAKKVRAFLIDADPATTRWAYVISAKDTTTPGSFGIASLHRVDHVYRDGVLVDPSEYVVNGHVDYFAAYTHVLFTREQVSTGGGLAIITVDLSQLTEGLRNPVRVVEYLLAGPIGQEAVDFVAFDTAATRFDQIYGEFRLDLYVDGQPPRLFADVLADCMFRLRLEKDDQGRWVPTLDEAPTRAALRIGLGDGELENIVALGPLEQEPVENVPTAFTLDYTHTRGFLGQDDKFLAHKTVPGFSVPGGQPRIFQAPYISTNFAADALLQYRAQLLLVSDEKFAVTLGLEARDVRLADLLLVQIPLPPYGILNEPFRVWQITRGRQSFQLLLARYASTIYDFQRDTATDQPAPLESTAPDLSFTPPPAPTGLNLVGWTPTVVSGTGGTGQTTARVQLNVTLPSSPKNGSHVVVQYRESAEPLMNMPGGEVAISDADWGSVAGITLAIGGLIPGIAYTFVAFVKNVNNDASALEGPRAVPLNSVAIGDTRAPDTAGLIITAVAGTGRTIQIAVIATPAYVPPRDLKEVHLYRNTSNSLPANPVFLQTKGGAQFPVAFHDEDINQTSTYYYWATLEDYSKNLSAFVGPTAGVSFGLINTGDLNPNAATKVFPSYRDQGLLSFQSYSPIATASTFFGGYGPFQLAGGQPVLTVSFNIRLLAGALVATDSLSVQVNINSPLGPNVYPADTIVQGFDLSGAGAQDIYLHKTFQVVDIPRTGQVSYHCGFSASVGAVFEIGFFQMTLVEYRR